MANNVNVGRRAVVQMSLLATPFAILHVTAGTALAAAQAPLPAKMVSAMLNQVQGELDYARAAMAFDQVVDPGADSATTDAVIARLVDAARQMAGPNPSDAYKLAAVRKAIYESGAWNYRRPFRYDLADPLGQVARSKVLSTYIKTRQGNCVTMPILFLIVADRMGLNVRLATAPLHVFVRYTDTAGIEHNIEATSGGGTARAEWYREKLPMTDRSIDSGIYMRTLSKRESIAEMANTIVNFLLDERRYQEAINVADMILAVNPREAYTMVKKGTAIAGLMRAEFDDRYASLALIPPPLRAQYRRLAMENAKAFHDAEALGWEAAR